MTNFHFSSLPSHLLEEIISKMDRISFTRTRRTCKWINNYIAKYRGRFPVEVNLKHMHIQKDRTKLVTSGGSIRDYRRSTHIDPIEFTGIFIRDLDIHYEETIAPWMQTFSKIPSATPIICKKLFVLNCPREIVEILLLSIRGCEEISIHSTKESMFNTQTISYPAIQNVTNRLRITKIVDMRMNTIPPCCEEIFFEIRNSITLEEMCIFLKCLQSGSKKVNDFSIYAPNSGDLPNVDDYEFFVTHKMGLHLVWSEKTHYTSCLNHLESVRTVFRRMRKAVVHRIPCGDKFYYTILREQQFKIYVYNSDRDFIEFGFPGNTIPLHFR